MRIPLLQQSQQQLKSTSHLLLQCLASLLQHSLCGCCIWLPVPSTAFTVVILDGSLKLSNECPRSLHKGSGASPSPRLALRRMLTAGCKRLSFRCQRTCSTLIPRRMHMNQLGMPRSLGPSTNSTTPYGGLVLSIGGGIGSGRFIANSVFLRRQQ